MLVRPPELLRCFVNSLTSLSGRGYDYIHGQYGLSGLIAAGVIVVVALIGIFIWFDRRK